MFYIYRRLLVLFVFLTASCSLFAQSEQNEAKGMTQARMAEIVAKVAGEYQGSYNNIQFVFNEVPMALISDAASNRMRIIAPVAEVSNLTDAHIKAAMVSNFHLALDARYAIGNGMMFAAYIHPMKELTDQQLESAISQVSTLRLTFGTKYTSGELTFGGRNPEEQDI